PNELAPSALSVAQIDDFISDSDGLRLIGAFMRIDNATLRRRIVMLVQEIAGDETRGGLLREPIVLNEIEGEAALANCRALINQINAGPSGGKALRQCLIGGRASVLS